MPRPFAQSLNDFGRIVLPEFDLRPFTNLVLRIFQQIQQSRNGRASNVWPFIKRTLGTCDSVNAAMLVIAVRIAQVMLHMPDDWVLPVREINRSIRPDVDGHRPEIRIAGTDQWRINGFTLKSRALFTHLDAIDPLEADDIAIEEVVLILIREMAAGQHRRAGTRAGWPVPKLFHARMLA